MNDNELNYPVEETSGDPSVLKSQNESTAKALTSGEIALSPPTKSSSPTRRHSSPNRRYSNLASPLVGSLQTPAEGKISPGSSSSRNMQNAEITRPKAPSVTSGPNKNNYEDTISNLKKGSIQSDRSIKRISSPQRLEIKTDTTNTPSIKSEKVEESIQETISALQPHGNKISDYIDVLTKSVQELSHSADIAQSPALNSNINKIENMSKILTDEARFLKESIRNLSKDIIRTKQELGSVKEDVNFPYHLFLIELIVNKIHMKCECFEFNYDNLVISATFLGKKPIVLYDSSYGRIDNFNKLNMGRSILFAMTYDTICAIKEFVVHLQIKKQPPCSSCVTKIANTYMDYTKEFVGLCEDLCKKWVKEQPNDNISCTTSTPLSKSMFYLSCCNSEHDDQTEPIGVIEMTTRMSFLGKEITTIFNASTKPQGTSILLKEDNGISMFSCQKVEMDRHGKILLDEDVFTRKESPRNTRTTSSKRTGSPGSQISSPLESLKHAMVTQHSYNHERDGTPNYDEIFTKMNENELKIKVPKSTKVERMGKYDRIQDLCTCDEPPYSGDQIQFDLPRDNFPEKTNNTYTSNLKYTYKGCDRIENKDRRIINVTPSNCPAPVKMEKVMHPQKDVFILRIGKKLETKDKKTDLEIELVTPKAPAAKPVENNEISQQCSTGKLEDKSQDRKSGKKKLKKGKSKTALDRKKTRKVKKLKTRKTRSRS